MSKKAKRKMEKNVRISIFISIFIVITLLISLKYENKTIPTEAQNISSKKIEWGIKRNNNNEQPDVGATNKKLIEENNGICIGNKDSKKIYLTFDLGYEAGYTNQILDVMKENEVTGTFFITAHYLNTSEELVKKMIDNGNIVGNHTVNHKCMAQINEETLKKEVMDLHEAMKEKLNYEMKYLRPPKGEFSEKSLIQTTSLGYQTVMWSFAYADWDEKKQPSEEEGKNKILENLHNGEIMLLHATSKTNANILNDVLKEIKNKGYEIKSLDEFEK